MKLVNKLRPSMHLLHNISDGKELRLCEVGVQRGKNAKCMLKHMNIRVLYLVDPYEEIFKERPVAYKRHIEFRKYAVKHLKKYEGRFVFLYQRSDVAYKNIPFGLDGVYIDGGHDYKTVSSDITNYITLVKQDGIIAGHDVNYDDVRNAVTDFLKDYKAPLYTEEKDWWFFKK